MLLVLWHAWRWREPPIQNYISGQTTDVLGAHLGYGRGCVMCHAPHSGAGWQRRDKSDGTSGNIALWGQDLTPLYGQSYNFSGDGKAAYAVTVCRQGRRDGTGGAHDPTNVIIFCLSCHDGNLAKVGMMKKATVETLPIVGGNAPTLLGNDGTTAGNYGNDHPVGAMLKLLRRTIQLGLRRRYCHHGSRDDRTGSANS